MRNETRALVNKYIARVAQLNGIPETDVAKSFVAAPSVQQALWKKIQESSALLALVNMYPVAELTGELIGMGVTGTIAGRTNTDTTDRVGQDPTGLDDRGYLLKFTEFDVFIKWAKLDQWAKFPNFQTMWADLIAERIALDLIMVGWNGTSAAAVTDRAANPLLQDVNIGWLQKMRTENPGRVLKTGKVLNKVSYGTHVDADYVNLDALVYDAVHELMPAWARGDTKLVAITSGNLLHDKYLPLINRQQDAENTLATDVIMSTKRLGGKQAAEVPYFPDSKILITRFDNLSIYYQEGAHRRHIFDKPERARTNDFQSNNLGYVIEDLEFAVLIENIELKNAA